MIQTLMNMDPATIASFVVAGILLNLTPGADVIFASASGVSGGWRAGVAAAFGISMGTVVHITLAAIGISAVVLASPWAYDAIRYVGAAYLAFLAVKTWRADTMPGRAQGATGLFDPIRRGFLTNVLNPKVALFILAFLPQFTAPAVGPIWQQIVILGALFVCTGFFITSGYGVLAGLAGASLNRASGVFTNWPLWSLAGLRPGSYWTEGDLMSDFPTKARVVIIGGGVVGTSSLYHLAKKGWSDCVLLEKNELTAGSTWHAAGNVPTFSSSWGIMNMQRYSTELYARLGDEVDYPMNYHQSGSIRLAHSKERVQEFQRAMSMGRYQGIQMEMWTPEEAKARYPFLETHDLEAVLYDPTDGDIDPAQLTQALAKGARDMGARILRFTPATGVTQQADDSWVVHTGKGDIACDYVVNAAGYYAQRVGAWFKPYGGRDVPMMVMSHQYLLTEEIPEVEAWSKDNGGAKLPLLRDVDVSYYLRQEKHGYNLGPYEPNCRGHWMTEDDRMPEDFSFQLWSDDLDRIEDIVTDAMERVPLMATSGISRVINGPIPYAPDGLPLIGPMPGVKNAFENCVFTFGIAQGGGAGKVLAEWIVDGAPEWDMWAVDPRRYTDYTDQDYCNQKGMEVYGNEYAMHFPRHEWPAGRGKKLSPVHDRVVAQGGVMGAYNGWERANWFAQPGDDTSLAATHTWGRSGPWEPRVREECEAVRDGCGVLDLPGFSRFDLRGAGAAEWLCGLITGALPKVGRMNLAYFADPRGRILTEMSVLRFEEDVFSLITAAGAQWHDGELLRHNLPEDLTLRDVTTQQSTLIVSGPKSRDVLAGISDGDFSLGWLTHQPASVAGKPVMLVRVSFAGELGWEVHAVNEDMPAIYDAILAAGARPFGMYALDSLRLEKGYRTWKGDLSTDYSLLEGGLERFVKLDKPQAFPGKAALQAEMQQGVQKRSVTLRVEAGEADAPYMSCLWKDGEIVGETTSGGWGYRVNASIALGMVRADLAVPGTDLQVEIYGEKYRAVVQEEQPLWDPANERLRA